MKDYLLLFRGGDQGQAKSPEESQAHMQRWMQWMGELTAQGKFGGAQPLNSSGRLVKGSQKIVTDGPYIEGKEMVGGYLICKADSYEEATEISKNCPILEFNSGVVEVREIQSLPSM